MRYDNLTNLPEKISCNVKYNVVVDVENAGDIVLHPTFEYETSVGNVSVVLPKSVQIPPSEKRRCVIGILCVDPGEFSVLVKFVQAEETKSITISGTGTMISLSISGRQIASEKNLVMVFLFF